VFAMLALWSVAWSALSWAGDRLTFVAILVR
jgi:hypothetical protein